MAASVGIQSLGEQLNQAVQTSPDQLPVQIQNTLHTWITEHLIPVLLVALIFVTLLFTFYGAFLYFTAYGDENRATQAKKTITYAIVGLVISLTAFGMVYFVQNIIISRSAQQNFNVPTSTNPNPSP